MGENTPGDATAAPCTSSDDANGLAVVAIGASSGGLDACKKLLAAVPEDSGLAFILIQHLDPTHESMMVDLLTGHTALTVTLAQDGMAIAPDHVYAIPPDTSLSIRHGALHVSKPEAKRGARMPFDVLLHSLAETFGARGIGVVLTGTGTDGTLGLTALKQAGGFVIAQDPAEAEYDGMPASSIAAGVVDRVLPLSAIPAVLMAHAARLHGVAMPVTAQHALLSDCMGPIIALLHAETGHDFSLYKHGTLHRRIERRMAVANVALGEADRYLQLLRENAQERDSLVSDLLIHVTSFFRDQHVFTFLERNVIPALVREARADQPLRIWVPGCSSGEEAYSLAILFHEAIAESGRNLQLKIFASDVDPTTVVTAREGLFPITIEADVTPERLKRFFVREEQGYRVASALRADIVFTVQDVLSDPPFSRLDMVSCRNLLIYLLPDAQARVIALCHFALRKGGVLVLGNAEAVADTDRNFEAIAKPQRVYRHRVASRPGEVELPIGADGAFRIAARVGAGHMPTRLSDLAELCRRMVLDSYAPAAVLINDRNDCLYSLGPTDRYLRVAIGHPSNDLLAMARRGLAVKLRGAVEQARELGRRVIVPGGTMTHGGATVLFKIDVQPVNYDGEKLLLVCFVDEVMHKQRQEPAAQEVPDTARSAVLEDELESARLALDDAVRDLEFSAQEQKAMRDETLSVTEEYQSTNEELLTSKEELQSLNEELVALNGQLQETLEQQRTTSNDLKNVLYSTDVATLFLDTELRIRLFTPATTSLFRIIAGDVGRPIGDLRSLAPDVLLGADARAVLTGGEPIEREIESDGGICFLRRMLPYLTRDGRIEGIVVTFNDITERKNTALALALATRTAEAANLAKSRFLAAASHDLRQPLQTLALIEGMLAQTMPGEAEQKLLARFDHSVKAMSGMLNALLDINQIEAGAVLSAPAEFPVNDLLTKMVDEFAYIAEAHELTLRAVQSSLRIRSDPRLLEQMIRNLLSNAIKYTASGKVLLGCRRRGGIISIEVWDTGEGIEAGELSRIFEEFYQVGNPARTTSRGLGLGLSIVQRLGQLMGHEVTVRSTFGKGSMFAIAVERVRVEPEFTVPEPRTRLAPARSAAAVAPHGAGSPILVVDDDPELRELLQIVLAGEGYAVTAAADAARAIEAVARAEAAPDLVLTDHNLPGDMNGLQLVGNLRKRLGHTLPAIVLTGDISTMTMSDLAAGRVVHLSKPVAVGRLKETIARLLTTPRPDEGGQTPPPATTAGTGEAPTKPSSCSEGKPRVLVVDDDSNIREGLHNLLVEAGFAVERYASGEAFLAGFSPGPDTCLLIDAMLPGMNGIAVLQKLLDDGVQPPAIMITAYGDVMMAVQALHAGASDFIEKPVNHEVLLASIKAALERGRDTQRQRARTDEARKRLASLTPRQREIMDRVLAGEPNKNIAADLGISQRTVENHRATIMERTGASSLPALARLALVAGMSPAEDTPA